MTEVFHIGKNRLSTPVGRWASVGPYYAMFPLPFAFDVVENNCPAGGAVLDPFAGRGSSLYAAVTTGRYGCGIEINDVGWLYCQTKLDPARESEVLDRNRMLGISGVSGTDIDELPDFFHICYSPAVLQYLCAARMQLDWRQNQVDRTLMAIILVYLHGAKEKSLSNQMRQGKAMAPEYSVKWWNDNQSRPPDVDPVEFLDKRIRWRYAKGIPQLHRGMVLNGDSIVELDQVKTHVDIGDMPQFDLLFTSPPYYNVTSYHYDQWLRLWLLGHSPRPTKTGGDWQNGFWSQTDYRTLLEKVFSKCATMLKPQATVWVRTDARSFTRQTTQEMLQSVFPEKRLDVIESPISKRSQTALYGDTGKKPGEIDLVLKSR